MGFMEYVIEFENVFFLKIYTEWYYTTGIFLSI